MYGSGRNGVGERMRERERKNETGIVYVCLSVCRYAFTCVRKIES